MSPIKWRKIFYLVLGPAFIAYGLRTIVAESMSLAGSDTGDAAWALYGDPAIVLGAVLAFVGMYILWMAFINK
jgi:hypothetical protein